MMNSLIVMLLSIVSFLALPHLSISTSLRRRHQTHRYDLATTTIANVTDDDEITNEDTAYTILDIPIVPLLRLDLFETPTVLSQSAIDALTTALSEHATYRLQLYFRDTIYFFDRVDFKVLDTHTVQRVSNRKTRRRVFEVEEEDARDEVLRRGTLRQTKDIEVQVMREDEEEDYNERYLQGTMYGTSLLLGGYIKFSSFPSAPSSECNEALFAEMKRNWFILKFIEEQNHPELANIKQWLISVSQETPQPTIAPTSGSPTKAPVDQPSPKPSIIPTVLHSKSPSSAPTVSIAPSILVTPSIVPSVIPIVVGSSLLLLVAMVLAKKVRKDKKPSNMPVCRTKDCGDSLTGHRPLEDDDDVESFENEDRFDSIPGLAVAATNEESNSTSDSDEDNLADYFSEPSAVASSANPISISSCQTMKTNNVKEREEEQIAQTWMKNDTTTASTKPPIAPSSLQLQREAIADSKTQEDSIISPKNINLGVVGSANASITSGSPMAPGLMRFFVKGDGNKNHTKSPSVSKRDSPITTVTPTNVTQEEFEKDFDVQLPSGWSPKSKQDKPPKSSSKPKKDSEDVDGSFPKLQGNGNKMPSSTSKSYSSRMQTPKSMGESTAYHSANEVHPLDWSKGSEFEGASIGDSTYTDDENNNGTPNINEGWQQVGAGISPLNLSALTSNFMTPNTADNRTQASVPTPSVGSLESTTSSRGSSKQLINDLVWLEKKIADVRKRVDKLDDEGSTTVSPPMSPESTNKKKSSVAGSPISHNIVCRDVIAPPGRLNVMIHSTKDGPAIHSVKGGSVLEGKLFKGDLVVAVDDIDTRTLNAVDVMEMMADKSDSERKITVIHFDKYDDFE